MRRHTELEEKGHLVEELERGLLGGRDGFGPIERWWGEVVAEVLVNS